MRTRMTSFSAKVCPEKKLRKRASLSRWYLRNIRKDYIYRRHKSQLSCLIRAGQRHLQPIRPDPSYDINYKCGRRYSLNKATCRAHDISQRHKFPAIVTAPNPREGSETFGSRRHDQRGETIDGHDPGYGWKTRSGLLRALSHDSFIFFLRKCSRRILINGQKVSPFSSLSHIYVTVFIIYISFYLLYTHTAQNVERMLPRQHCMLNVKA